MTFLSRFSSLSVVVVAVVVAYHGHEGVNALPNIIVAQPDDLPFFEGWTPPNHSPGLPEQILFPASGLPNLERLREEGVQMMQAYTVSPKCATSRYSTLTGRYASRSSFGRGVNSGESVSNVGIPTTKLLDVSSVRNGNDCSENNLPTLLQKNGYRTGMVGKWHLMDITANSYNYNDVRFNLQKCGFDVAESIYSENLGGRWHDGTFSHNMEYMTAEAIDFIRTTTQETDQPFFLYFNPTAPHGSGSVREALTSFSCKDTPAGRLGSDFSYSVTVPDGAGSKTVMNVDSSEDCQTYRQTVLDRASGATDNVSLGCIWIDDAIGALIQTLKDTNQYDNTFFLFQMDHGQELKGTLWEPGIRMAQFVKLPNQSSPMKYHGMVSTIDIAPTILDYANIDQSSSVGQYDMDGISWKSAVAQAGGGVVDELLWNNNRCLFFEMDQDRAVRCGCYKYMTLESGSITNRRARRHGYSGDIETIFDMCDGDPRYDHDNVGLNPESTNRINSVDGKLATDLSTHLDCHVDKTSPLNGTPVYTICGPDTLSIIDIEPRATEAPDSPAPVTPAPITPAPETPAPATPAPTTLAPVTPAPETPAPVTLAPVTAAPATAAHTPAPVSPAPATLAPVTSPTVTPTTLTPVTQAPSSSLPNTPEPVPSDPITLPPSAFIPPTIVAPVPMTPTPSTSIPDTSAPVTSTPTSSAPTTSEIFIPLQVVLTAASLAAGWSVH